MCLLGAKSNAQLDNRSVYEYYNYLTTLPFDSITSVPKAVNKYKEIFRGQNLSVCDTAYVVFYEFYMRVLDDTPFDREMLIKISEKHNRNLTDSLADYALYLKDNGFVLRQDDDFVYVQPDDQYIASHFFFFVSREMQIYQDKLMKEENQGFVKNDKLMIPLQDLADRVAWWENFYMKYPNFVLRRDIKQRYDSYMEAFVFGLPKTPIFTGKKGALADTYKKAYQNFVKQHPGTYSASIIERYMDILRKCKYKACDDALLFTWKSL